MKRVEAGVDNLIKEEFKVPVRLNLFNSFDENDNKLFMSNSFVREEKETIKATPKMLFAKDFSMSF